jgi:hypothetical protein
MATFGDIGGNLTIPGGQSIRRNATDTAFESYTPSGTITNTVTFTVITESTTARTLAVGDAYSYIRCTAAASVTITIPTQANAAWEAHTEILFEQAGTGQVTVAPASGVTLRTTTTAKTSGQYAVIGIKRVAQNEWVCVGDRATS